MSLTQRREFVEKVAAAKRETKSRQAHRLADYLLINESALTAEIARDCAIGNISAAACYIRPALEKRGLTIIARLPHPLLRDRFGNVSQTHEWSIRAIR